MKIELDMYQTLAVAVLVLMLGKFLRARVQVLERFCIPAPVIGGVLFAIFTCVCYVTGVAEFAFDDILKEVCMVMFFTSVGFQANLKVLKSGGRAMIVFLGVVIVLIVSQNFVAVGLAKLLGVDALVGLCTGSIPMVGGHGTAGAFGPVLEDFGIQGATTLCTAAATYGLIAGSMMGGPIGKMLIERHNLLATVVPEDDSLLVEEEMKHERHTTMYPAASFQLIVAMGIGTVLSRLLSLTGMTFPIYIGAMIAAAIIRNVGEYGGGYTVYMGEINDIGGICLSLFLGMAMITLKLWQLAELALPEPWRFRSGSYSEKNYDTPILERYIQSIFRKQVIDYNAATDKAEQDRIILMRNEYACFHTGLYTKRYKPIYACFGRNKKLDSLLKWCFRGFADENSALLRYISPLPEKPLYSMPLQGIHYVPDWPVRVNVEHILGDPANVARLPTELQSARNLPLLLETAVELARRKVVVSPGDAVPQIYQQRLQYLLPLCLTDMEKPDLAITLRPMDGYYMGYTCLTLEMAYLNARLLARPTAKWLLDLVE